MAVHLIALVNRAQLLARHRVAAQQAALQGPAAVREFSRRLSRRVMDTRNLRLALDHVARFGGPTAGLDGLNAHELRAGEKWNLVRWLAYRLRNQHYAHGPVKVIRIPKGPGRGYRQLAIENLDDRVVSRGLVQIVQPLLDPLFDGNSFQTESTASASHR